MPVHDWSRVGAWLFHDFHLGWISSLSAALNALLPPTELYALIERAVPDPEPWPDLCFPPPYTSRRDVHKHPPAVRHHVKAEAYAYANRRNRVVVRDTRRHRLLAAVDVVTPANRNTRAGLRAFVDQAVAVLRSGANLLVVDLFPPSPLAPQGIHKVIWEEFQDDPFTPPPEKPFTLAAYVGGPCPEGFVEPVAAGDALPDMPLFLTPDEYVTIPLEATYWENWDHFPEALKRLLESPGQEPQAE